MKKTILFLAFLLCYGFFAQAQQLPVIDIVYEGSTAHVSIPVDVTGVMLNSATGSSHVAIYNGNTSQEYCFRVSGSSSDGSLTIQGNYKMTLSLAGCELHSSIGAAIDIECGKRIAVEVVDGTVNTLSDSPVGAQKAALYFSGHPEFRGGGTLNVTGNLGHAISAKEYLELKEEFGTINVLGAVKDGIHCGRGKLGNENNYFEMKGGLVNITGVGSDCIESDDYGCVKIKGGELHLDVSAQGGTAIKCDSIFRMTDGVAYINITGADAEGIRINGFGYFEDGDIYINNAGDGSKGIKLKTETAIGETVLNGGTVYFSGTDVNIALEGGNYVNPVTGDASRCMGISVDGQMWLTDGDIVITSNGIHAKAYNVKDELNIYGLGRMVLENGTQEVNPSLYQHDMSLYFALKRDGVLVDDYANYQVTAIGEDGTVRGKSDVYVLRGNTVYCYMRVYGNTPSETIRLQAYHSGEVCTYPCIENVTFAPDSRLGMPSSPSVFTIGEPTIGTVTRYVRSILDGEGKFTSDDVLRLVDRILQKEVTQ